MREAIAAVCLCLVATAGPAPAQAADPLPGRLPGLKLPARSLLRPISQIPVGTWVEYSLRDRTQHMRLRIRFALVGHTARGYWWEVSFRRARTQPLHIKVLSKGSLTHPKRILRVIVQTGRNRPLELPLQQGQRIVDLYVRPGATTRIQRLGTALLTTPAGQFRTSHRRWRDATGTTLEEWTSPGVHLFGLVKFRSARFEMVIIRQGTHGRSQVRGIPARWRIPGL